MQRLNYEGAIHIEAQIIQNVFRRALALELSPGQVAELKYWDSSTRVLKAFVLYCLQYEKLIAEYALDGEHILGLFILTVNEQVQKGRVEPPIEIVQQMEESRSRTRHAWRNRLVFLAKLSAIEIHTRSGALADQKCKEPKAFEDVYQELKDNLNTCQQDLEDKLWRRAS
jgi:hypothetical protein